MELKSEWRGAELLKRFVDNGSYFYKLWSYIFNEIAFLNIKNLQNIKIKTPFAYIQNGKMSC